MSKPKLTYSVKEAKQLLLAAGYSILKHSKHEIWETKDSKLITARKARYALTISKDPLRQGTMQGLRDFLGFASWQDLQEFWMKIK